MRLNNFILLNELEKKLELLDNYIEQIKKKGVIPKDSPLEKLIIIDQKQIKKIYLADIEATNLKNINKNVKTVPPLSSKNKNLELSSKTTESLSHLEKMITGITLDTERKDQSKIYFTKIKEQSKNYLVGIRFLDNKQKELLYFKKQSDFFKIQASNTNIYFITVTNKNQVVFYNKIIKKNQRSKILKSFIEQPPKSSKYITVKSKTNSSAKFYFLNKWQTANLNLIIQSKNSNLISTLFSKQIKYTWVLALAVVLFFLSLFIFWHQLSTLSSAYNFLKSTLISFNESRQFPLDSSKNPLLYFYNNRIADLNKKPAPLLKEESKNLSFQSLIKKELKLLKASYPNLKVEEDYSSNIKIFGAERFLKTVIHEIMLNALESMGTMEIQRIDLNLKEEKNNIVFSVRDYGIGLKNPKKAFEMYYSTKSQLGVGLNLVESIVKAKGGQIKLQPLEKGGVKATISFSLKVFLKQY